jgi:hypothetical protein
VVFQAAVDGVLSVHGCGSVHTVVELREGVRDLHHLTGHYLRNADSRRNGPEKRGELLRENAVLAIDFERRDELASRRQVRSYAMDSTILRDFGRPS